MCCYPRPVGDGGWVGCSIRHQFGDGWSADLNLPTGLVELTPDHGPAQRIAGLGSWRSERGSEASSWSAGLCLLTGVRKGDEPRSIEALEAMALKPGTKPGR